MTKHPVHPWTQASGFTDRQADEMSGCRLGIKRSSYQVHVNRCQGIGASDIGNLAPVLLHKHAGVFSRVGDASEVVAVNGVFEVPDRELQLLRATFRAARLCELERVLGRDRLSGISEP